MAEAVGILEVFGLDVYKRQPLVSTIPKASCVMIFPPCG